MNSVYIVIVYVYVYDNIITVCTHMYMYLITSGVEKNDTSKRNYFSSNKHEFPGEIIMNDYCLNELQRGVWGHPTCVQKRPYCKRDTEYWEGGRIQAIRKRQRAEAEATP